MDLHILNIHIYDRSFAVFLTEIRHKAILCEKTLISDQIVIGTNNPDLRERLLQEPDITITKAINLCRASEQAIEQSITKLEGPQENKVDLIQVRAGQSPCNSKSLIDCRFYRLQHNSGNCKVCNATCHRCKKNHFIRCCLKKLPQRTTAKFVRGVELKQDPLD